MRISEIKRQARASLKGKWGSAVLLTFILALIGTVPQLIIEAALSGGIDSYMNQDETPLSANFADIIISLILIPLTAGTYWYYLKTARLQSPKIGEVFAVYKDNMMVFKTILLSILVAVFTLLWTLLLIVPGIIKSFSYSQGYFLLKDYPHYTPLEAIRQSRRIMKGYKWKYFLLLLSFIGWGLLSILTLGIGLLWLVPYISASCSSFYHNLPKKDTE